MSNNKFTEYNLKQKYGIDDLKSEYAFSGNSQGDDSVSNDIKDYKNSGGWMSFNFKGIKLEQKEINKEVLKRKEYNKRYIESLKQNGTYGKEYVLTIKMQNDTIYEGKTQHAFKTSESYRFDILNLNNDDKK